MCGLYGIISEDMTQKELEAFKWLGTLAALRGVDSTGILSAQRIHNKTSKKRYITEFKPTVNKTMAPSPLCMWQADWPAIGKARPPFMFGHARAATVGAVNMENCHPFEYGNIIGMHNGTILKYAEPGLNDSQTLIKNINAKGLEETLDGLPSDAAYAIIYVDKETDTINIIRNEKRTLYLAHAGMATFFASESWMLSTILSRLYGRQIEGLYLKSNHLYTWEIGSRKTYEMTDMTKEPVVVKPAGEDWWTRQKRMEEENKKKQTSFVPAVQPKLLKGTHVGAEGYPPFFPNSAGSYEIIKNTYVTADALKDKLLRGCVWSGDVATIEDYETGDIFFLSSESYIFTACLDEVEVCKTLIKLGFEIPAYVFDHQAPLSVSVH